MKARYTVIALLAILAMTIGACANPTPQVIIQTVAPQVVVQTVAPQVIEKISTQIVQVEKTVVVQAATPTPVKALVTWFQYDQGNVDPKSDERVGNQWLRDTIPQFNKEFAGKYVWDNQFSPWDRLPAKLVAAVQAKGEVADIVEGNTAQINLWAKNGAVQDLSAWAKQQKWYAEMDAQALKICTTPDGKLVCIPTANRPTQVFVWKDRYPNGFPKTAEDWLKDGERLKAEGKYAMTFFGNTGFNGDGANRAVAQDIIAFGGAYDDGNGKLKLNTPENVAAINWLRQMVQNGYVPEIAFAGNFQEEQAFMDASAGAIPTGLFGYRYINPLTTPSGKKYEKKTEQDMLDAIAAGDVYLSPFPGGGGHKPACSTQITGLFVPTGAKNLDGAHDFINWVLSPAQNPAYVTGPGAGIPVLKSVAALPQFQTKFYQEAGTNAASANCQVIWPTVVNTPGASTAIMNAVYKLIKTDPKADIATELQKAQDDFNKTVR